MFDAMLDDCDPGQDSKCKTCGKRVSEDMEKQVCPHCGEAGNGCDQFGCWAIPVPAVGHPAFKREGKAPKGPARAWCSSCERLTDQLNAAMIGQNERQSQFEKMGHLADEVIAQREKAEAELDAMVRDFSELGSRPIHAHPSAELLSEAALLLSIARERNDGDDDSEWQCRTEASLTTYRAEENR